MFVIYIKNGMKNTPDLMLSYFFSHQICVEVRGLFFWWGGGGGENDPKPCMKGLIYIITLAAMYMYPVVLLFLPSFESKCNEYPHKKNAQIRTIKLIRSVEVCISAVINHL